MKKVICKRTENYAYFSITYGKVYDVIYYQKATCDGDGYDYMVILDDNGIEAKLRATNENFKNSYFDDITSEFRSSVIEEILS